MSITLMTGCSDRRSTTMRSYFDRLESSPPKSGCIATALSLASLRPEGKAQAITSPGAHI